MSKPTNVLAHVFTTYIEEVQLAGHFVSQYLEDPCSVRNEAQRQALERAIHASAGLANFLLSLLRDDSDLADAERIVPDLSTGVFKIESRTDLTNLSTEVRIFDAERGGVHRPW